MKNANKIFSAILLTIYCLTSLSQGLDSNATSKVNNAMAKRWTADANATQQSKNGYETQNKNKVLNVGSGKNCNLNIGTKQPGQKGDVIVTTKEVINVCK